MQPGDPEEMLQAAEGEEGGGSAGLQAGAESQGEGSTQQQSWDHWWQDPWSRWNNSWWNWHSRSWNDSYWEGAGDQVAESGGQTPMAALRQGASSAAAAVVEPQSRQWSEQDWRQDNKWWQAKGDFSDPPPWPGWQYFRQWKKALMRWDRNTDVPTWRRAEKILKSFDYDLQMKLDHLDEALLSSPDYLVRIMEVLDTLAGERDTSERRRAVRAALYEGPRRSDESLAQYALRREAQFQSADQFLRLPEDLKGFMMEEQAGLSKQNLQNLRVLTAGNSNYDSVRKALKVLDIEEESLFRSNSKGNYFMDDDDQLDEDSAPEDEDLDLVLYAIDEQDLNEYEALNFLTEWQGKKRTWSENKLLKAAKRKDRRHFDKPDSRHQRPGVKRRLSIDELKKVSRCGNCLERGHWHEECKNPYKPREPGTKLGPDKKKNNVSAFTYLGSTSSSSNMASFHESFGSSLRSTSDGQESFVAVPAGHAIVDPGASQDLIGKPAFDRLVERLAAIGLQPVKIDEAPTAAAGIGGRAEALFVALTPCFLGKKPGIIKLTVLKEDIPQLLSIGLLEHAKSIIDTGSNQIEFKAFNSSAPMVRLESGHRVLDIASWNGENFEVPDQVLKEFNLSPTAFQLGDSDGRAAYMAAAERVEGFNLGYGEIINQFFVDVFRDYVGEHSRNLQLGSSVKIEVFPRMLHDPPAWDRSACWKSSWWLKGELGILLEDKVFCSENSPHVHKKFLDNPDGILVTLFFDTPALSDFRMSSFFNSFQAIPLSTECQKLMSKAYDLKRETDIRNGTPVASSVAAVDACHGVSRNRGVDSHQDEDPCAEKEASSKTPGSPEGYLVDQESPPFCQNSLKCHEPGLATSPIRETSLGTTFGSGEGSLVRSGPPSTSSVSSGGQSSHAGGTARIPVAESEGSCCRVPSPSRPSGQWRQSVRTLDQVLGLQEEAELRGLSCCQQPSLQQEQERRRGCDLCPADEGTPQDEERLRGERNILGHHNSRVAGSPSDAESILGAGHHYSVGSYRDGSATSLAGHGIHGSELGCGITAAAASSDSSSALAAHDGRGCADEPESRFGLGTSAVMSIASFARHYDVSLHESLSDPDAWLVASLSPELLGHPMVSQGRSFFQFQTVDGGCYLCWWNGSVAVEMLDSDFFDDREFMLRKRSKKQLLHAVGDLLLNTDANSRKHFVSSVASANEDRLIGANEESREECGEDARTSRPDKDSGKDARTLRQLRSGGDPRTPRSLEDNLGCGEDVRTSRSLEDTTKCNDKSMEDSRGSSSPGLTSGPPFSEVSGSFVSHGNLREWSKFKVCELFSPPRLTPVAVQAGLQTTHPAAFDLETGWDFFNAEHRARFWHVLRSQDPDLVVMSPDCVAFSVLMNVNWDKMDPGDAKRLQEKGLAMLHFCVQVAEHQLSAGKLFLIEHPGGASSWATHGMGWLLKQSGVMRFLFDQCAVGLSVDGKQLSRKTTGIATNSFGVAAVLSQCQCSKGHEHLTLESGRPHLARVYPPHLLHKLIDGIRVQLREFKSWAGFDDDLEEALDEEVERQGSGIPGTPQPVPRTPMVGGGPLQVDFALSPAEKEKLRLVHVNMGHLPKEQMLMLLKAAGAKPKVLSYVKNQFNCNQCMKQHRPVPRRKAAFPRTFSFNRIVGVDMFYISWENRTLAFLNIICHGTNFQQVAWLKQYDGGTPDSRAVWRLFNDIWVRPFGLPETLISDGGGEFKLEFERGLEQSGVLQVISDAHSPWQNGRAERHGQWVKAKAEDELQAGQSIVDTPESLDLLLTSLVSHKNRWFHRGGFSPCQLVFGCNPRVPFELLSDDNLQTAAISDLVADPFDQDTPAAEFSKCQGIRQRARELCIQNTAKDKIRLSSNSRAHQQKQWFPGQWVYIWRKFAGTGLGHVTRSRWCGPGLVVMQQGHTVWVSLRSRLLKCNSDQLRAASHEEAVGAELHRSGELKELVSQTSSHRASAVDVSADGPPPPEAIDYHPVVLDQGAPELLRTGQLEPLPPIPEDNTVPAHVPARVGVGSLVRDVAIPPERPDIAETHDLPSEHRRLSRDTVVEPSEEPNPSVGIPTPSSRMSESETASRDEKKRRLSSDRSRKRPSELEVLEREALRELRRLDREERANRRSREQASASTDPAVPQDQQAVSQADQSSALGDPSAQDDLELAEFGTYFSLKLSEDASSFMVKPEALRNGEFNLKFANPEERLGFEAADVKEWQTMLKMQAAEVLSKEASKLVWQEAPERVLSSRMIRRKKPVPGVGNYKFKSRWCVHGHQDPDSLELATFSPMPSTEAIVMFFQLALNLGLSVSFADVMSAFCQADPLDRPKGDIFIRPCEGLPVSSDHLIRLRAPVYGLDDAPLRWHRTLLSFFKNLGFCRSLLEPCWLIKRVGGSIVAMILIEVDDLNIASTKELLPELREALEARFTFGKWEQDEADFAGRHVRITDDKVLLNQEKYILEKLQILKLGRGKLSDKQAPLAGDDFEAYRSLLYKVNWLGHQTRPEVAGVVSLLSSRLQKASVYDVCCLNKAVSYLRGTACQGIILHKFDNKKFMLIAASDAGGVGGLPPVPELEHEPVEDTTQGAWIILGADSMPSASRKIKVSVLSWRSTKLRRKVPSTLAGEALAFSQSLGEIEWFQILFRDIIYGDVNRDNWRQNLSPFLAILKSDCQLRSSIPQCSITDAKSLYDSVKKGDPSSRQDRRTAIELAIICEAMSHAQGILRWVPHPKMIADGLTKDDLAKGNGALEDLLKTGRLCLWDELEELDRRKKFPHLKARSKKASEVIRSEAKNLLAANQSIHVNRSWWELLNCSSI